MTLWMLYGLLLLVAFAAGVFMLIPALQEDRTAQISGHVSGHVSGHASGHASRRYRFFALILAAYVLVSLALYSWIGAPRLVPVLAQRETRLHQLTQEITENLEKVKTDPQNLSAWVILGSNFLETGQIDSAVAAFKQAVILSGGSPALVMAYTKAQIMQADGKVTDDALRGIKIVQMLQPENPEAKYYMAVRLLQEGKTQEAMRNMKALYQSLPEDSELKATINRQIGRE